MSDFASQNIPVLIVEERERLESSGILGDEGTLLEYLREVAEAMALRKRRSISNQLIMRDSVERVGELGIRVVGHIDPVEVFDFLLLELLRHGVGLDAGGFLGDGGHCGKS